MVTKEKLSAALKLILIVSEAIREAKQISNGHLYAAVMDKMDLATYTSFINLLKRNGLVREENHLLIWEGPK